MTERGFHPFAVLHFLRKTILVYLLPLVQVLFARNWAALRTALVQVGCCSLAQRSLLGILRVSSWRWTTRRLLVHWRLGIRLDRALRGGDAGCTDHRPAPGLPDGRASRLTLYPAGAAQKHTLSVARTMPSRAGRPADAAGKQVVPAPEGSGWCLRFWGPTAFPRLPCSRLRCARPALCPGSGTLAYRAGEPSGGHCGALAPGRRGVAAGGRRVSVRDQSDPQFGPDGTTRSGTVPQVGAGAACWRYECRVRTSEISFADAAFPRDPGTDYWPVFVSAGGCAPRAAAVRLEGGQAPVPGAAAGVPDAAGHGPAPSSAVSSFCTRGIPLGLCLLLTAVSAHAADQLTVTLLIPAFFFGALLAGACGLPAGGRLVAGGSHDPAAAEGVPPALHLCAASGPVPRPSTKPLGPVWAHRAT